MFKHVMDTNMIATILKSRFKHIYTKNEISTIAKLWFNTITNIEHILHFLKFRFAPNSYIFGSPRLTS